LGINFFIAKTKKTRIKDAEKLSAYECGFDPFEEARLQFNVHYYIVGLLFLIFDIEIVYLFPAVGILQNFTVNEIINIFFFLTILTVGFLYE
jgi:NADH-quinone oxidoreductase subunit A